MKKPFILIFLVSILLWPACHRVQKSESNASVEVIDGIEYIHNTETPMYPDKTVSFVEDLSLKGEDKEGNIVLFEPMLRLVDDQENIYLSELKEGVIKVFDSNGEYIKTIGAQGNGPGEFQMVSYLAVTKDGGLIAFDSRANRTSFFDSTGLFLRSFQWRMGYYSYILVKSSSYIVTERAYSGIRENAFFYVKEFDFEGNEIRSFGEFAMPESLIIPLSGGTFYAVPPVSDHSIFAGDQAREVFYHCLNSQYVIEVYDSSGKLFRKIDRPYVPVPYTEQDAKDYRRIFDSSRLKEEVRKAIQNLNMPKVKSVVSRMYVDDKSNLWFHTYETKEEEGKTLTAFDIFDSDGYYYAKVWTDISPQIFKKGKMYRIDTDEDSGYRTLKRYKVVWE